MDLLAAATATSETVRRLRGDDSGAIGWLILGIVIGVVLVIVLIIKFLIPGE